MQISLLRRKFVLIQILFCRQSLDLYYDQGTLYEWLIVYYCKLMKSYDESNYRVQLTFNDLKKINGPRKFVKLILNWPFFLLRRTWVLVYIISLHLHTSLVLPPFQNVSSYLCWSDDILLEKKVPCKVAWAFWIFEATFCYGRIWLEL
jgi:hypothetical protein